MEDEAKDVPLSLFRRIIILIFCMLILTLYFTTILVVSAILPQIQGALSATTDEISWIMTLHLGHCHWDADDWLAGLSLWAQARYVHLRSWFLVCDSDVRPVRFT